LQVTRQRANPLTLASEMLEKFGLSAFHMLRHFTHLVCILGKDFFRSLVEKPGLIALPAIVTLATLQLISCHVQSIECVADVFRRRSRHG